MCAYLKVECKKLSNFGDKCNIKTCTYAWAQIVMYGHTHTHTHTHTQLQQNILM